MTKRLNYNFLFLNMEIPIENVIKKAGQRMKDIREIFYPAMDITEDGELLHIYLDLPGFRKEDIKILTTKTGLKVSGSRKKEYEGRLVYEERVNEFSKFIRIMSEFDNDSVIAKMDNGVLTITVKRKEIKNVTIS
jgi:HSP20 family protein